MVPALFSAKEPVDLPWLVTKPWRVYSDGGSYEEALHWTVTHVAFSDCRSNLIVWRVLPQPHAQKSDVGR